MKLKQKIYYHFLQIIITRIQQLQNVLDDLKESGSNETKSTAGDKHETALAMLQIEQANTRAQMKEAISQKDVLEKIDQLATAKIIVNGSVVKTNRGYFFVSTALGKAAIEGITIIALSAQSPLGAKLMGLTKGDTATVNDYNYVIENIE